MNKLINCVRTIWKCVSWTFDRESEYFASVFCTGDTLILGGLLQAYRSQHPGKKVKVIIKSSHRQIIDFYKGDMDEVIEVDAGQSQVVKIWFYYCSTCFHHMHYCLSERTLFRRDPDAVPRLASLGLLHCYKKSFSLMPGAVFKAPDYPLDISSSYGIFRKKYGAVSDKIVILAPYTVTLKKYDYVKFFEIIAERLRMMGYMVFTNTIDERVVKGTTPLRTSFREITSIGQNENLWVISVRSGLCDLLEFTKCRLTVLYPTETDYQIFSLERMFGKRKGRKEFIVFPDSQKCERILYESE